MFICYNISMVRTTIILEDQLYKELVSEAVRSYGSTRRLSFLINQKLKGVKTAARGSKRKRLTITSGKPLKEKDS